MPCQHVADLNSSTWAGPAVHHGAVRARQPGTLRLVPEARSLLPHPAASAVARKSLSKTRSWAAKEIDHLLYRLPQVRRGRSHRRFSHVRSSRTCPYPVVVVAPTAISARTDVDRLGCRSLHAPPPPSAVAPTLSVMAQERCHPRHMLSSLCTVNVSFANYSSSCRGPSVKSALRLLPRFIHRLQRS